MEKKLNRAVDEENKAYIKYKDTHDAAYLKTVAESITERQKILQKRLQEIKLDNFAFKTAK